MPTERAADRPRYFALELAEHFLAAMHPNADEDERERVQMLMLSAGQHLADRGAPGLWDELDPASFLEQMQPQDDRDRVGICLDLVGLYGWLGTSELMDPMVAAEMLVRLRAAGPDHPLLRDLCEQGVAMLGGMDEDVSD